MERQAWENGWGQLKCEDAETAPAAQRISQAGDETLRAGVDIAASVLGEGPSGKSQGGEYANTPKSAAQADL